MSTHVTQAQSRTCISHDDQDRIYNPVCKPLLPPLALKNQKNAKMQAGLTITTSKY